MCDPGISREFINEKVCTGLHLFYGVGDAAKRCKMWTKEEFVDRTHIYIYIHIHM